MKHENFNFKQHGFVGHLAEPDAGSDRAVIVIMGGEQSLLSVIKFAERFADYGIMREKRLYRMIPLIGLMYKTFGKYRKENLGYFAESEKEIIGWVKA